MNPDHTAGVTSIPGIPTTVLVAPDSFKGTFTAAEVADAIGRGLEREGRPVDLCPVADGGEGTLDALLPARSTASCGRVTVTDPLGRPIEARRFALGRAASAIVETAAASGLGLVDPSERDAVAGQHVRHGAADHGGDRGGRRARLPRRRWQRHHRRRRRRDPRDPARPAASRGARIVVLTDVRTPFEHAARVFGPQKGADEDTVSRLTKRLNDQARRLKRDPRGVPMTGAAGGLSGGLWAEFGAELVPGAQFVLDAVDFDRRMRAARAVVTGEGKLDQQSLAGKVVSEVATRARQAGVPCHAIVGTRELDSFGVRVLDLQAVFEAGTTRQIRAAARRLAERALERSRRRHRPAVGQVPTVQRGSGRRA